MSSPKKQVVNTIFTGLFIAGILAGIMVFAHQDADFNPDQSVHLTKAEYFRSNK